MFRLDENSEIPILMIADGNAISPLFNFNSASESAPKFRSRFLDKVRGSFSEKPDQRFEHF